MCLYQDLLNYYISNRLRWSNLATQQQSALLRAYKRCHDHSNDDVDLLAIQNIQRELESESDFKYPERVNSNIRFRLAI